MKLAKLCIVILLSLLLSGCLLRDKPVAFRIESNPPGAKVTVSGMYIGETPIRYVYGAQEQWVGIMNSPDGYGYVDPMVYVKCTPPLNSTANLHEQMTLVDFNRFNNEIYVTFDLTNPYGYSVKYQ